ncbi:unnamed protein product [Cylindrotheca closterium]|uniref:Ribonuclease n=1 Tax=Cylindrotheca closterium TaxID=2856 RepID=A0AAD2CML4_9STRA|nr:unnamed protein product [Cylindrotheca closterium]
MLHVTWLLALIVSTSPFGHALHTSGNLSRIRCDTVLYGKYGKGGNNNRRNKGDVLNVEKGLAERGFDAIIGSDETGRGSIAGPVLAASLCIQVDDWNSYTPIAEVGDSKTLDFERRERIFEEVVSQPDLYHFSVAERSNEQIDDSNIVMATMECFAESIEEVVATLPQDCNAYSIVDGKKSPKLSVKVPCRPWVKGDAEVYTISLASILAKVTLDRNSKEWHEKYPEYGFDEHKGYATKEHIEAIHRHGPCPIHRLSFKSLKGR